MLDPRCSEVRLALALDDRRGIGDHLEGCDACRLEARRISETIGLLSSTAEAEPSADADRRIRALIAAWDRPLRPPIAVGLPVGLGIGSALAFLALLACALAQAGAVEQGLWLAALALWAYLGFSFTALLPLLLAHRAGLLATRERIKT